MPYIGNTAADRFVASKAASVFSGDGSTTAFTLDHSVGSDEDILVSVDGVIQEPSVAYSVSGTTLTFTAAPSSNAGNNIFVYYLFRTVGTVSHPSSNALEATSGTFSGDLTVDTSTLKVDSTNNRVGIGTATPQRELVVNSGSSSGYIQLANTASGTTSSNGLEIKLDSGGAEADIINRENGRIGFWTNNTERMRIESSGNVDVKSSGDTTLKVTAGGTSNDSKIDFVHGTTTDGGITFDHNGAYASEEMIFRTGNNTPNMRLTGDGVLKCGNLNEKLGGGTSFVSLSGNGYSVLRVRRGADSGNAVLFYGSSNNTTAVGSIDTSSSSTSYNTSSDHRLKENVVDMTDATTRLKQLQPKRFNFIVDADTTVDGFLAHEVQSVVPEAITGTHNEVEVWKDGEELPDGVSVGDNKLDEDGNTIPVYQGIDQSKLVPLLVKTIQELEARITALENS